MKKILFITTVALACSLSLIGCGKKEEKKEQKQEGFSIKVKPAEKVATVEQEVEEDFVSLAELAKKYDFKVGTCIANNTVKQLRYKDMVKNDFNTITACNEFKAYSLLNQAESEKQGKPVMNYTQADEIAKFAQENGIGIRGHVLVWDAYMSNWFFREGFKNDGELENKEEMQKRVASYIEDVITHFETEFPGVVYCWDVVNEAVADGQNEQVPGNPYHLRETRGGSSNMFYDTMGEDYVLYAFQCARNTVNKLGADIKLFYNDYNTFYPDKRDAICNLIQYLNKKEKLCDGIGMQGYIGGYGQQSGCMNQNDLALINQAIAKYTELGIEVQLTEVAVRNYNGDEATMAKHARFYADLFKTIIAAKQAGGNFTGITIWGICDNPAMPQSDYSYKMNGPYCGLFNYNCKRKDAYKQVNKVLQ